MTAVVFAVAAVVVEPESVVVVVAVGSAAECGTVGELAGQ